MTRKSYPSDVSDEEWALFGPYLTLMTEDAPQREHSLREVSNGLRWIIRTGAQWRMMLNDLPPWLRSINKASAKTFGSNTGDNAVQDAQATDIELEVVKLPTIKRGFVLLSRRWVVERRFGWMARFRRLARDYDRLSQALADLHFLAFAILMLSRFISYMVQNI